MNVVEIDFAKVLRQREIYQIAVARAVFELAAELDFTEPLDRRDLLCCEEECEVLLTSDEDREFVSHAGAQALYDRAVQAAATNRSRANPLAHPAAHALALSWARAWLKEINHAYGLKLGEARA